MKKLVIILTLLLGLTNVMAQQTDAKVAFKGVSLNDKAASFVSKLSAKGFVQKAHSDGTYLMTGKFLNEDCVLLVYESNDSVLAVQANYGVVEDPILGMTCPFKFSRLHDYYVSIVNLYKEKYGNPVESVDNSSNASNGLELYDLKDGKIQVQSTFRSENPTDGGVIVITLSPMQTDTGHGAFVSVFYKTNRAAARTHQSNLDEI